MLEEYFIKPSTIDRLRSSWIAPEIEAYVVWLANEGFSTKCVWRRVPIVFAFGEFGRSRGAETIADLSAHVEAFVAERVAEHHRRNHSTRLMAKEVRGPIEQLLSVVLSGFEPTGRRPHSQPFVDVVPGFFDYLVEERGLRPASIHGYRHHLDRFEAYLARIGLQSIGELSPVILDAYIVEHAGSGLAKSTVGGSAGVLRVFLRYAHREGVLGADLSGAVGWPQVYRLSNIPRSISWDDVNRVLASVDRRTEAGRRNYAILLLLVTYGLRGRRSRRSAWTTSTGRMTASGSPSARPATQQRSRSRPSSVRRFSTTCVMDARRPPIVTSFSTPSRPGARSVPPQCRRYVGPAC